MYLLSEEALPTFVLNLTFPNWNVFEFVTKKIGASGPTIMECMDYYQKKWETKNGVWSFAATRFLRAPLISVICSKTICSNHLQQK